MGGSDATPALCHQRPGTDLQRRGAVHKEEQGSHAPSPLLFSQHCRRCAEGLPPHTVTLFLSFTEPTCSGFAVASATPDSVKAGRGLSCSSSSSQGLPRHEQVPTASGMSPCPLRPATARGHALPALRLRDGGAPSKPAQDTRPGDTMEGRR